jgi:catechol 2,3-dioxygenase-like lactoylglutathione lyase family enzyme
MRLPRYRVLTGPDDDRFCERVSEALDLGYALHGGPTLTSHDGTAYLAQAVVWPIEDSPPPRRASSSHLPSGLAPISLDHCVIHVSDWNRSNAFYRDVLGAELIDRGNGAWAYRFGHQQLNAHGPGVAAGPVARVPVAAGNSDLCFTWFGPIDQAIAHLARMQVTVEEGPVARHGAEGPGQSVYFRDPDGSLMEFISYQR